MNIMIIDKEGILKILNTNFDFKIIEDDVVGSTLEMDPADAYYYSVITGSPYLNNPDLPFNPKGKQTVFIQAMSYTIVTSFFFIDSNGFPYPWNTPIEHSINYPFIQTGKKRIIPLNIKHSQDRSHRKKIFDGLIEADKNPCDYLLTEVRLDIDGYGLEPFLEYTVSNYYRKNGYITETQIPLLYGEGTPDVGAFKIPLLMSFLRQNGIVNNGAFLIELSSMSTFKPKINKSNTVDEETDIIVGEAKAKSTDAQKQVTKYVETGLFNKAYEIMPYKKKPQKFGLITFDSDGKLKIMNSSFNIKINKVNQDKYIQWLVNYIKYYLLGNLTKIEFIEIMKSLAGTERVNAKKMIQIINNQSLDDIKKIIKV
jgi:hypothetical protein